MAWNGNGSKFRTLQFIFVNMFLHEIGGHLFMTYLTKGRVNTPPHIRAGMSGYSGHNEGESGRHLEVLFFRGNIEIYRDSTQGNDQVRAHIYHNFNSRISGPSVAVPTPANASHSPESRTS